MLKVSIKKIYDEIFEKWKESAIYTKLYENVFNFFDESMMIDDKDNLLKPFKSFKNSIQLYYNNKRHVDLIDRPTGKSYEEIRKKFKKNE